MKRILQHNESFKLEHIVRNIYNCGRGGVMGVADADHIDYNPMEAVIAIFAPCYMSKGTASYSDIDQFVDKYNCIFHFTDSYEYDKETVENFFDELDSLITKYYGK